MKSCAEAILALLEGYDVDTVFGIPGIHTINFYDGFKSSRIRHVTPRHEQGAAFMAYGYALASGKPGVCVLITGPGVLNAVSAIGEAYANSVPLLILASNNLLSEIGLGEGRLHETRSQTQVEEAVTAFTHLTLDKRNLPAVLARAFVHFESARPRPVCIDLPRNVASEPADFATDVWPRPRRPSPNGEAIAEALALLRGAERPLMVLGGGAAAGTSQARALAEHLDLPVVTSISGKGIVPEDHPLSLGCTLPFRPIQEAIRTADVVLAVGTELAETDTLYTYRHYTIEGKLIRIDIDPDQLGRGCRPYLPIIGDAATALRMLKDLAGTTAKADRGGRATVRRLRAAITDEWMEGAVGHKRILDVVRRVLPATGIVSADSTQIAYTGCHYYPSLHPHTWLFPVGYGGLGSGLPVAIGAKLGAPDRDVVAIAGDGGFLYTIEELAAAVELELALPIIVWDNQGYGEIAREMDAQSVARVGVDLRSPDFVAIARGFGCHAHEPDSLADFESALREALVARAPTLLLLRADAEYLSS